MAWLKPTTHLIISSFPPQQDNVSRHAEQELLALKKQGTLVYTYTFTPDAAANFRFNHKSVRSLLKGCLLLLVKRFDSVSLHVTSDSLWPGGKETAGQRRLLAIVKSLWFFCLSVSYGKRLRCYQYGSQLTQDHWLSRLAKASLRQPLVPCTKDLRQTTSSSEEEAGVYQTEAEAMAPLRGKKLLFVMPTFGAKVKGGAESFIFRLAMELGKRGVDLEIWTSDSRHVIGRDHSVQAEEDLGLPFRVRRFRANAEDEWLFDRVHRYMNQEGRCGPLLRPIWVETNLSGEGMVEALKAEGHRFDVIHLFHYLLGASHQLSGLFPEKTLLHPFIHNEAPARNPIMRELFAGVAGVTCNSWAEWEVAMGSSMGLTPRLFRPIGNGVESSSFPIADDHPCLARFKDSGYILFIGRMITEKNLHELLAWHKALLKENPQAPGLVCIGEGPLGSEAIFQDHPKFQFLGWVDGATKRLLSRQALALVQPSLLESFSLVIMEAWLEGTPVIVHEQCGATRDHARQSGAGAIVKDADSYARAVMTLHQDSALRQEWGAKGKAYVESHYSWHAVCGNYAKAVADLLQWDDSARPPETTTPARGQMREKGFQFLWEWAGIIYLFFQIAHLPQMKGFDDEKRYEMLHLFLKTGQIENLPYSLVMPLFAAPLYGLAELFGGNNEVWTRYFNRLYLLASLGIIYAFIRAYASARLGRRFILLLLLATPVTYHMKFFYSEFFTAATLALGTLALASHRRQWLAWLAIPWAQANMFTSSIGLGFCAILKTAWSRRWRYLLLPCIGALIYAGERYLKAGWPIGSGYEGNHGPVTAMPFSGQADFSYPFLFGVLSLLFSFGKGLLFYNSGLLLPLTTMKAQAEALWRSYTMWLALLAGLVLMYAKWWAWHGDIFWGPRFLLIASFPSALALAWWLESRARPWLQNLALVLLLTLSFWVGLCAFVFGLTWTGNCYYPTSQLEALCHYTPDFSPLFIPLWQHWDLRYLDREYLVLAGCFYVYFTIPLWFSLGKALFKHGKSWPYYLRHLRF